MKNLLFLSLLFLGMVHLGCGDKCDDIECGVNGTCVEGICNCDPGYSGENCENNVCDALDCINGECDPATGACICDEGYEGTFCDSEIRARFLGTWTSDAWICDGENDSVTLVILAGSSIFEVRLSDESQEFFLQGTVDGNMLTFPNQDIEIDPGEFGNYEGDCLLDANGSLTFSIIANFDGEVISCSGIFMR